MKIATMVRGYLPVPRPTDIIYAPIDLAVALTSGLSKAGHSVDFFAPVGSEAKTPTKSLDLPPLVQNQKQWEKFLHSIDLHMHYTPLLWDYYLAQEMFHQAQLGTYDLLHFHHAEIALLFAIRYPDIPIAITLHDPMDKWFNDVFKMYQSPNQFLISISDSQRAPRPDLSYAATVYNGVDTKAFPYSAKKGEYLLYVGRIVPDKGVKEAVEIAQKSNQRLLIVGSVFPDNRKYFNKFIKPYLNDKIQYIGYVEHDKLPAYYQKAKALLMPLQWEEPFGMNMIESLSCGTPVIALRRGSVPEVIVDKKTGYIADNLEQMVDAVNKLGAIRRADCRKHVVDNFSIEKMIKSYEIAFKKIIKNYKKFKSTKAT